MTTEVQSFMGKNSHDTAQTVCFARATSAELKRRYPENTIKQVARDLGCTPKAAENLLDGHLSAASVARLINAYGPGWVAERVLEAAGSSLEDYIRGQAEEARTAAQKLEKKAENLAQLEGELRAVRRARLEGSLGGSA